ncbi:MAG: TonB-dependent receptor, partial [Polaribacter sp.]
YSPNPKLDLSGFLIWSGNSNGQRNINDIDYVDPNIPDEFRDTRTDQTSNTGLFRFSTIYKKDFNNQLNYNISGRFSNEYSNQTVDSRVLSDISQYEKATPFTINQDFSYFYTAGEKSIFALEVKHLLQDEDPFYIASLENDPNNNDNLDNDGFDDAAETLGLDRSNRVYTLEQDRRVASNQLDAKLDYYYILNQKSNLNFVAGTILSQQNFDSRFFQILENGTQLDPIPTNVGGSSNPPTTNDTEYNFTDIYAGLRYRLRTGIFTVTPGFTLHSYNSNNTQYSLETFEDKFFKFLPEFNVIAQFKQSESLNFTYRQQVNFTDVNQIARGIVARSYDAFFSGNPELINASFHNVNLSYRSFNLFNNSNVFSTIRYTKTIDQVNNNVIFQPGSVVSNSSSINSPLDNENLTAILSAGKTFGKIQTRIGGNYNYSKTYQFFNRAENTNINNNYGVNARIGTNFRKAPNVSLRYAVNFSNQENTARPEIFKSVNHRPSINFDAYIKQSITLTSDFSYTNQRQNGVTTNTFSIWNAKLAYRKDKDAKLEYEVVGNNLLATGSEASVSQNLNAFTLNERFILPRFISFRIRYQL